jgi:hypothetical protein
VAIQGFTSLSINLDKSKTDFETAKGTNKICAVKTRQQVSDENIWTPWNGGYYRLVKPCMELAMSIALL